MTEQPNTRSFIVLLTVVIEGGLVLAAWFFGWLFDHPPLARFRPEFSGLLWGVLAAVPMLLLFFVMDRWPIGPLRSLQKFSDEVLRPFMLDCTMVDLIGISCLAGFGEELAFRGLLQAGIEDKVGVWMAVTIASVLFGLMHAINLTYVIVAAGMGVYLGWLFVATDNLLVPMVTHAVYDFVVLLWVLRGRDDEEEIEEDEEEV